MPRKRPKYDPIGTTYSVKLIRNYESYQLVERVWADGAGGRVSTREYHTHEGYLIDMQHKPGRRTALLKFLLKNKITPQPATPDGKQCCVGRAPDSTWYGWSHRAITGFKPGRDCSFQKSGARDGVPFQKTTKRPIRTERAARGSAIRFAAYVS